MFCLEISLTFLSWQRNTELLGFDIYFGAYRSLKAIYLLSDLDTD